MELLTGSPQTTCYTILSSLLYNSGMKKISNSRNKKSNSKSAEDLLLVAFSDSDDLLEGYKNVIMEEDSSSKVNEKGQHDEHQ